MSRKVDNHPHETVLKEEVVDHLIINSNGIYVDCTLGFGGHSFELLKNIDKNGKLIGIDFDPYALEYSSNRLAELNSNFRLFNSNYSDLDSILDSMRIAKVDGILFDLGISSYQVDSGYKGLSYRKKSPLDMRMDPKAKKSLRDILHESTESQIADIIYNFSDEKASRKIANSICSYIHSNKMEDNEDLVSSVREVIPKRFLNKTLSRVFQAFRILVNNELENLVFSLRNAISLLNPKGRLAVISFHSIEDRIVKNIFRDFSSGKESIMRSSGFDFPEKCEKMIKKITKKPIAPSWTEVKRNKRARSAKLRVIERLI